MSVSHYLENGRQIWQLHGADAALRTAAREARLKVTGPPAREPPAGLPDQRDLLAELFDTHERVWLIWFDGGRYDYFESLYREYLVGDLRKCWNGGIGYTGDWAVRHLRRDFAGHGLFSSATLRNAGAVEYDGRRHFDVAPEIDMPDDSTMRQRLATLGYLDLEGRPKMIMPAKTNEVVLEHLDDLDGGVVRYLRPHPPFDGLEETTAGAGKVRRTRAALIDGDLTRRDLEAAYVRTYRIAFDAAADLIADLDGTVVITADHGECLRCGQLYHSRTHERHPHLTHVPWFEVDALA